MVNSVLKAIQVMNLFSASEPRLTVTEISTAAEHAEKHCPQSAEYPAGRWLC